MKTPFLTMIVSSHSRRRRIRGRQAARLHGHADHSRHEVARPRRHAPAAAGRHARRTEHAGESRHRAERRDGAFRRQGFVEVAQGQRRGARVGKWRTATSEVAPKTGDIFTREEFGPDVQLHIEFATPPPRGRWPGPRQQRRLLLRPLRDPGPRQLQQPDLPRRPGDRHLRLHAAAGERVAASRASGRPTTSFSKARASRTASLRSPPTPPSSTTAC